MIHRPAAGATAHGTRARNAPSPVATPLPPRKRRNTGQQLPATAATAPAEAAHGAEPNARAALIARYPFAMSPSRVTTAGPTPSVRSTLVAPMVPLPLRRMSAAPAARATRKPIG